MLNDGSESNTANTQICNEQRCNLPSKELDLEKQDNTSGLLPHGGIDQALSEHVTTETSSAVLSIVVSDAECHVIHVVPSKEETNLDSPKKGYLSRTTSSQEQCRVCQQEKEEVLINLGCKCKGGLSKAHHSCIDTWFCTRGSNKCEICQEIAVNVSPPESHPSTSYRVWRAEPTFQPQNSERGCFSPLWVAFAILIGGLLLDVLISITLGVSALPVNIIIGVIVVLGLGTALRLVLEFCHKWSFRRVVREESNVNLGYHPSL